MTANTQVFPHADAAHTLVWTDALLLGYGPMDDTHREFVEVVSALMQATDAHLGSALERVERHLRAHFGTEDRWMVETDFPARQCHMDEHEAVLATLDQVKELCASGNKAIVRRFGNELTKWFPGHADYLDSALSHWMSKARLGGKPIVLRRHLSFDEAVIPVTK
jgi:hemerythrin